MRSRWRAGRRGEAVAAGLGGDYSPGHAIASPIPGDSVWGGVLAWGAALTGVTTAMALLASARRGRARRRTLLQIGRAGRWLEGRGSWILAFLLFVIVLGRAYHRLQHPQFWAEDGRNWYADAHNIGTFALLFQPYAGYLHVRHLVARP